MPSSLCVVVELDHLPIASHQRSYVTTYRAGQEQSLALSEGCLQLEPDVDGDGRTPGLAVASDVGEFLKGLRRPVDPLTDSKSSVFDEPDPLS